ncbi:HAD-IA family hydrolase [Labrenzia sp. PHM005]|uniref:HAD-IA family hydrolase n=1 Tax=Labrenzia sp. PHM005 TaxID=2590016 RepID=UPI00113FDF67|nr:HAD-IA family hydrolase [Labrenzia sp. PHM005]QDG77740.1 HAD-IA family hydrolase [Labrenzia sp. PHM005]
MLQLDRAYSAVLFDMDGTLLDSRVAVERVLTDWAEANSIDPPALLAVSHGRRTIDVVREFAKPGMDCETEAAKIESAEIAEVRGVVAIPGAIDLLNRLPSMRWAIVTSAGHKLAIRRLTAAGIPIPEVLVTAENIENGKPDPTGYLLAAEKLGTNAKDCLVFEDAPAGIQAGLNAGSDVIAIGYASPGDKTPDCPVITDFRDITFRLD